MKASDLFSLKGRVALVTGASSGLGIQFAKALADNGAAVALVARRVERLAEVKQAIEAAGGRALAIEADVTDSAAMAARLRRGREGLRHRHHPGQQCRHRAWRPRHRHDAGGMAARCWPPISTRCSTVRRKRRGACWPPTSRARSSTSPRCSAFGGQGRRRLCHRQGRRGATDQGAGGRTRLQGHPRQRHRAGLVRHRDQ